ncbi:hypothetical protein [Sulfitobacter guttiformis]|uniref:Uncharacterized protein n=1 Tax=Sulfitobacter guttiformis TaxID=74349 RepID=A0A420DP34_9RHOB|nr:hypothetical protein [Sulfitobacter guttiformis]KIN73256.1 Glycerol-3-phosphate dehydrogenase [Sulfitobacter guttiformis KCTC 32187]RKE95928.1 hypothetical protein C8N30_0474 [Sulfitobacter guttiformis]
MSKAVTNEEVEDVLSSIRRLVSEDKRPLAGLRSALAPQNDADEFEPDKQPERPVAEVDRLVLTPALRVAPSEPEPLHRPQAEEADRPLDLGSVARQTWGADDRAAVLPDDVSADKGHDSPMVLFPAARTANDTDTPDLAMDALDALVHDAIESEMKAVEKAHEDGDYTDEGFWEKDEDDAASAQAGGQDGNSLIETEVSTAGGDKWDLGEDGFDGQAPSSYHIDPAPEDQIDEAPFFDGAAESSHSEEIIEGARKSASVTPLVSKIAALGAAMGGTRQAWEPEAEDADEIIAGGTQPMAWEDDVELDARGEPLVSAPEEMAQGEMAHTPEAQDDAAATAGLSAEDQLMDEEALRDLVSEIVRAELQGALGERITRNVRKLVRREIHRALTAQELE